MRILIMKWENHHIAQISISLDICLHWTKCIQNAATTTRLIIKIWNFCLLLTNIVDTNDCNKSWKIHLVAFFCCCSTEVAGFFYRHIVCISLSIYLFIIKMWNVCWWMGCSWNCIIYPVCLKTSLFCNNRNGQEWEDELSTWEKRSKNFVLLFDMEIGGNNLSNGSIIYLYSNHTNQS